MYTPSTAVLRFTLFLFALSLYLYLRFVRPARLPRWGKLLITLLVFTGPCYPMLTASLWGGFVSPDSPRWVAIGMNLHSGFLFLLTLFTAVRDVALLVCFLTRFVANRDFGRRLRKEAGEISHDRRTAVGFMTASAGLAAVGVYEGTRVPDVMKRDVAIENLPKAWDGLRIAHLSDIHVSSVFRRSHFEELVRRTNALKPDLILITGDFVDGRVPARFDDARPLGFLHAPLGVWGCEGNHEHYSGFEEWLEVFPKLGIRLLRNEHVTLTKDGASLVLVGLTDSMAGRFGRETPDMAKALAGAPAQVPHILLVHRPGEARRWAEEDPDASLQLSGHTHGGQILGMHRFVALQNGGFVSGFYDVVRRAGRTMRLFVSPGSGLWNGFVMRLGVPSEITLLTLHTGRAVHDRKSDNE